MRIGQKTNRNHRAIKVWDKREYKDLDGTIKGTAHKGYLDIHMRPERRNAVKVLMFLDVGGSMDWPSTAWTGPCGS